MPLVSLVVHGSPANTEVPIFTLSAHKKIGGSMVAMTTVMFITLVSLQFALQVLTDYFVPETSA
jgi:hypothetical protein